MLRDYAQSVELRAPRQVFDEVASTRLVRRYPDAANIAALAEEGSVRVVTVVSRRSLPLALGPGEAAAIRLWFEAEADLLLSDDGRAIRTCRILGLPFTSSPRIVVDLHKNGAIRRSRARKGLEMLAIAGRYSRDVIAAALVVLQEEHEDD